MLLEIKANNERNSRTILHHSHVKYFHYGGLKRIFIKLAITYKKYNCYLSMTHITDSMWVPQLKVIHRLPIGSYNKLQNVPKQCYIEVNQTKLASRVFSFEAELGQSSYVIKNVLQIKIQWEVVLIGGQLTQQVSKVKFFTPSY